MLPTKSAQWKISGAMIILCCRIVNVIKNKNIKKQPWGNVECFAFGGATVRFAALETSFHATNHTIPPPPSYEGLPRCPKDKNRSPFTAKNHTKVDIFDIFVFKIVKSGYKTMFRLQNKKEYKIKMLHLYCLYHTESPDGQRLGRHIYI